MNDTELEQVQEFKYLGRIMTCTDDDWPAIHHNMKKARGAWARLSKILIRHGANPRISGKFYKAVIQTVLLYGCETWTISNQMISTLESFHHKMARQITRRHPRYIEAENQWIWPNMSEVLEEAGLKTMRHYINVRQTNFWRKVESRPLIEICRNITGISGSARHDFWWEERNIVQEL